MRVEASLLMLVIAACGPQVSLPGEGETGDAGMADLEDDLENVGAQSR